MNRLDRIAIGILGRWAIAVIVVIVLWILKIFKLIVVIVALFCQEAWRFFGWVAAPTKMGAKAYWSTYWMYWFAAYIILFALFVLWWFLWYRRKRPYLEIGGVNEGRVLWIKGIRRGLVYSIWDLQNYTSWKLKKKPLRKISRPISDIQNGAKVVCPTWPDPLAIPFGRNTSMVIIYYSRPWSLRIDLMLVPHQIPIKSSYLKVSIPEAYIINREDPLFPGKYLRVLTTRRPSFKGYESGRMRVDLMALLEKTKKAVQKSAAANPQLIHRDYEDGSYPLLDPGEVEMIDG